MRAFWWNFIGTLLFFLKSCYLVKHSRLYGCIMVEWSALSTVCFFVCTVIFSIPLAVWSHYAGCSLCLKGIMFKVCRFFRKAVTWVFVSLFLVYIMVQIEHQFSFSNVEKNWELSFDWLSQYWKSKTRFGLERGWKKNQQDCVFQCKTIPKLHSKALTVNISKIQTSIRLWLSCVFLWWLMDAM